MRHVFHAIHVVANNQKIIYCYIACKLWRCKIPNLTTIFFFLTLYWQILSPIALSKNWRNSDFFGRTFFVLSKRNGETGENGEQEFIYKEFFFLCVRVNDFLNIFFLWDIYLRFYVKLFLSCLYVKFWTLNDSRIYVGMTFGIPGYTAIYKTSRQSSSTVTQMIFCVILQEIHYACRNMEYIIHSFRSRESQSDPAHLRHFEEINGYTREQIWISLFADPFPADSAHWIATILNRGTQSND